VHREYIGRRGDKILGEEIDGGFDTIGQLGASKVEPTHDHVNWSRKPLDRIFDNVHDSCVRASAKQDKTLPKDIDSSVPFVHYIRFFGPAPSSAVVAWDEAHPTDQAGLKRSNAWYLAAHPNCTTSDSMPLAMHFDDASMRFDLFKSGVTGQLADDLA
jgi:hypothetical protein